MIMYVYHCPMSNSIYIVRHGETKWNVENRFQGKLDSPLTAKGVRQAHASAAFFLGLNTSFSQIYSSPIGRAQCTAKIIAEQLQGVPLQTIDILEEIFMGELEGMDRDAVRVSHEDFYRRCEKNRALTSFPEGESYFDVYLRVRPFLKQVMARKEPVIIVAHEGINRVIRGIVTGKPLHESVYWRQGNDEIFELKSRLQLLHKIDITSLQA